MTLHFAYGSNMNRGSMRDRCPGARPLGACRLDDWRFVITRDSYASVVQTPGSVVHGVLWQLTDRDLAALEAYESLDSGLYRGEFLPVRHGTELRSALAYIARSTTAGRPLPGYQEDIVAAARNWNFPSDYIAELASWLPGAQRSAAASSVAVPE